MELWAMRQERRLTEQEQAYLLNRLPPERRARLERLRRPEKWDEALCAYGLLTLALRERWGWEELPAVTLTERGKPYFSEYPEVHFSLSHTEGAVLVGVAERPIGVDIEKVRPVSRRMLEQIGAETPEAFFRSWVRREARGKRSGAGIGPMVRRELPQSAGETYVPLELFPGYAAGVALTGSADTPKVHLRTLEDLLREKVLK